MVVRVLSLAFWAYLVWWALTWSFTLEQALVGLVVALAAGFALSSLGEVVRPWRLASPRRLVALSRLAGLSLVKIVVANLGLARRIWSPRRPLSSGMVRVPTAATTDGELAGLGLITSLIVDNQLIDLDRGRRELQYHAVAVPRTDREREAIIAPIESLVRTVAGTAGTAGTVGTAGNREAEG